MEDEDSELRPIRGRVQQGSVLSPVLQSIYTQDILNLNYTNIATFADETALMAVANVKRATAKLQNFINKINQ